MTFAPLTSGRTPCPHCGSLLTQAKPGRRGSVQAHVVAEPECFVKWHLSRACPRACRRATYWCGYLTFFQRGVRRRGRKHKHVDCPDPTFFFFFFFFSASNGVARSWLRRRRYRHAAEIAPCSPAQAPARTIETVLGSGASVSPRH